jgi:hypothetical protein
MKNKLYIFFSIVVIAILIWLLNGISNNFDKVQNDLNAITKERDKNGALIVTQNQQILSMADAMKVLKKTKNVSKVSQQTQMGTSTIIVEKKIPVYFETIRYVDSATMDTMDYMKLPYTFEYNDTWNNLQVTIDALDITLDTMSMKNNFTITIGEKSNGWLKESTPIVEIKSDNPYTDVTSVKNVTIKKKNYFWSTMLFGGVLGALTMLLVL